MARTDDSGGMQQLPQIDDVEGNDGDGLFVTSSFDSDNAYLATPRQATLLRRLMRSGILLLLLVAVIIVLMVFSVVNNTSREPSQLPAQQEPPQPQQHQQRISAKLHNATIPEWKALPDPSTTITRISFGSCMQQEQPQPFWDTLVAGTNTCPRCKHHTGDNINKVSDMFILMGDNVYGDCESDDDEEECPELRSAYYGLASHPSLREGVRQLPVLATLDDHDYGYNDCYGNNPHKELARELFADFFDIPLEDLPEDGVYRSFIWGEEPRRTQVILLDARYSRSAFLKTGRWYHPPSDDTEQLDEQQMLGEPQWAWLEDQLKLPAELRIIVSSIQVVNDVTGLEGWRHLPQERERLYDLLYHGGDQNNTSSTTTTVGPVLLLSGDRHFGGLYEPGFIVEVTSSSLTHAIPLGISSDQCTPDKCDDDGSHRVTEAVRDNNFGTLDIDWDSETVEVALRRTETVPGYRYIKTGGAGEILASKTYSFEDLIAGSAT